MRHRLAERLRSLARRVDSPPAELPKGYSSGEWFPALSYSTPGGQQWSLTARSGQYTKIGDRVFFTGYGDLDPEAAGNTDRVTTGDKQLVGENGPELLIRLVQP